MKDKKAQSLKVQGFEWLKPFICLRRLTSLRASPFNGWRLLSLSKYAV